MQTKVKPYFCLIGQREIAGKARQFHEGNGTQLPSVRQNWRGGS